MTKKEHIITGKWSLQMLEELIMQGASITDAGSRIAFLSKQFIGIPYQESTLVGDQDTEEVFTVNLEELDCFTMLDYIEAMRLSSTFSSFRANLKKVRYQNGIISFEKRNHFFSDWAAYNSDSVEDFTGRLCPGKVRSVKKQLNLKDDGFFFVPGIRTVQREIKYIPSSAIDDAVTSQLMTGDYIGIYSSIKGLDVSHVGIFIRDGNSMILRHAAARTEFRYVIDEDFMEYVAQKPGIMVLRPKDK
jgi:hypothetical protein